MKNFIIILCIGSFVTLVCHAMDDGMLTLAYFQAKDLTKIAHRDIKKISKVYTDDESIENYIANLQNGDIVFANKDNGKISCVRRVFDDKDPEYANCQTIILDRKYYGMIKELWKPSSPEKATDTSH